MRNLKALLSSNSDEYSTPGWIFAELDDEFGFTLDPCATEENHKCERYFTKENNGLKQSWKHERVFCNPPYSEIGKWVKKAWEETRSKNTVVVAFLWSFGNNAIDYLWSKDKEEVKLSAFAMLTRKTVDERYRYYKRFVKALKNFLDAMSQNDRFWSVEPIERIQSIENIASAGRVQPATNIQFTNASYSEYERMDGDVVYCDIPYEKSKAKTPYNKFDHKAFYDWAHSRTYPVYISSYEISDERFKGVVLSKRRQLLGKGKTDEMRDEMIYMNEAAVKEQETIINEETVQMSLFEEYK